jgi:predicted RNA-binding Zn-ribbon protein involved in translation (DUF1610 family)
VSAKALCLSREEFREHREDYDGYCTTCEEVTRYGETEPDAEEYECPQCGQDTCYGIEQALLLGYLEVE